MNFAFPDLRDEACNVEDVERLQSRHEVICRLKLMGMKHVDIARAVGVHPVTVKNVLGKEEAQNYINHLSEQADAEAVNIASGIHEAAVKGIKLLDDIISGSAADADIKQRQAAALEVLRMDGYSPITKQVVDHRHGFLEKQGMENIGRRAALLRERGVIDVTPSSIERSLPSEEVSGA